MKKRVLLIGALLLIMTGCSALVVKYPVEFIGPETVLEKMDNEDTFSFVSCDKSSDACKDILKELNILQSEYDITMDYYDFNAMEEEEEFELFEKFMTDEYFGEDFAMIPGVYIVKDGEPTRMAYDEMNAQMISDKIKENKLEE